MQSKGAGPVNRVELESQVLCAALRQSCHLKDRVGSFTSVRELSHLFPDLLPPPEKHDEASGTNKANYYSVLGVRPQTSANAVIAAYLRTVRAFLRTQRVADARAEYNRILNAGFILRKPRLRLSHDLVVTRRWLHEESRKAQIQTQEVTLDRGEAIRVFKDPLGTRAEQAAAAQAAPAPVSAPQPTPVPPMPPMPDLTSAPPAVPPAPPPNAVPPPPVVPAAAVAEHTPAANVPPVPPLPQVAAAAVSDGFATPVEVPPVPPLPVAALQPNMVPPVPPLPAAVNEFWEKQQAATAVETPPAVNVPPVPPLPQIVEYGEADVAVAQAPPVEVPPVPPYPVPESPVAQQDFAAPLPPPEPAPVYEAASAPEPVYEPAPAFAPPPAAAESADDQIEIAPGVFVPASSLAEEAMQIEAPSVVPDFAAATGNGDYGVAPQDVPPPAPVAPPSPLPMAQQPAAAADVAPVMQAPQPAPPAPAEVADFPPAAVRAQQMPPPVPPEERGPGRISKEATFVFDESALAPPVQSNAKKVPMLIQLLEAAQFITPVEVQALTAQMAFAPNIPVEKLILNAGYVTAQEMASVKLGESLLQSGKINMAQFQVAIYDERTSGLRMAESLQVRGWLSVEVRNAIDEFHKKSG